MEPIFRVNNEGAMREEVEVEIKTLSQNPFKGTITDLEVKYKFTKNASSLALRTPARKGQIKF
jgi:hypothetical protein